MTPHLTLPVKVERVIDGDTLEVTLVIKSHVRLLDCWAPESHDPGGPEATASLRELALHQDAMLTVPIKPGKGLSELFTFGRVLGYVNVNGTDLSQAQCAAGHATKEK